MLSQVPLHVGKSTVPVKFCFYLVTRSESPLRCVCNVENIAFQAVVVYIHYGKNLFLSVPHQGDGSPVAGLSSSCRKKHRFIQNQHIFSLTMENFLYPRFYLAFIRIASVNSLCHTAHFYLFCLHKIEQIAFLHV